MKEVEIYCDGACDQTTKEGGYAAILKFFGVSKEVTGSESNTTNNRMEIRAAIEGLKALKQPCVVRLYSDSQYLTSTMSQGWSKNKNIDLWEELSSVAQNHWVHWIWVARNSTPELERCDQLAKSMKKVVM